MRACCILVVVFGLALLSAGCGDDGSIFSPGTLGGTTLPGTTTPGVTTTMGATTTGVTAAPTTTVPDTTTTTSAALPVGTAWARVPDDPGVFAAQSGGTDAAMRSVVQGGPGLVAVGYEEIGGEWDGAVWTSADGLNWTRVPASPALGGPLDQDMVQVVAGGPGLVAIGGEYSGTDWNGAVWTSGDGVNWSRLPDDAATFGGPGNQDVTSVVASGPGLVAVGLDMSSGNSDAAVWTSGDGLTWTRVSDPALGGEGDQVMESVAVAGPGLVAVGSDMTPDGQYRVAVWTSFDGLTWTRVPHDDAVFGGTGWRSMYVVAGWGQGVIAAGFEDLSGTDTDAAVWTSPDGVTWTRLADPGVFGGAGGQWAGGAVGFASGAVLVGGEENDAGERAVVWATLDGVTWTRIPDDTGLFSAPGWAELSQVAVGGPGLVGVGSAGSGESGSAAVWVSPPPG